MDRDRTRGAARAKGGQVKKASGKALGDQKMRREGRAQETAGKAQNTPGGMKDSPRESGRRGSSSGNGRTALRR